MKACVPCEAGQHKQSIDRRLISVVQEYSNTQTVPFWNSYSRRRGAPESWNFIPW